MSEIVDVINLFLERERLAEENWMDLRDKNREQALRIEVLEVALGQDVSNNAVVIKRWRAERRGDSTLFVITLEGGQILAVTVTDDEVQHEV